MKKKVLLFGGSGMVGRNILSEPEAEKWDFVAPDKQELNLDDFQKTLNFIERTKPQYIINAAGFVGGIEANKSDPLRFLIKNLDIGRNLLLAAKYAGVKKLLNLGASCMYPKNILSPLREDMLLSGFLEPTNEGYALAKISVAKMCQYITNEMKGFKYKTMIPCNIFGLHDNFDEHRSHLVPAIIKKLHLARNENRKVVEIWGDGSARREFMYSSDLANAVIYGLDNFDSMPEILNIGVGEDYSVNHYYKVAAKIIGYNGSFTHNIDKPVGMKQKLVDIEKQLSWGWSSKVSLADGIAKTYDYYLNGSVK